MEVEDELVRFAPKTLIIDGLMGNLRTVWFMV